MSAPGEIVVEGLVKAFDETSVVNDVSFRVAPGDVLALLGPSGCGKTTTLKCLAGLESPDAGTIRLGETVVFDAAERVNLAPNRRHLGMVFQSYAVWPHMTVFDNVAFPLQVARLSRSDVRDRAMSTLELVGLDTFADRPATELSGGQQQRVALARALVGEPPVVLFDEPLSNLDARLRERMRFELAELQERVGYTAIYVTHDQEEAMAIASQIAVMLDGTVRQAGTADEVYGRPRDEAVARFMGVGNMLAGEVTGERGGPDTVGVRLGSGEELVATAGASLAPGAPATVVFAPEALRTAPRPGDNELRCVVEQAVYLGYGFDYRVQLDGTQIRFRESMGERLAEGDAVTLGLPPGVCTAVPRHD